MFSSKTRFPTPSDLEFNPEEGSLARYGFRSQHYRVSARRRFSISPLPQHPLTLRGEGRGEMVLHPTVHSHEPLLDMRGLPLRSPAVIRIMQCDRGHHMLPQCDNAYRGTCIYDRARVVAPISQHRCSLLATQLDAM